MLLFNARYRLLSQPPTHYKYGTLVYHRLTTQDTSKVLNLSPSKIRHDNIFDERYAAYVQSFGMFLIIATLRYHYRYVTLCKSLMEKNTTRLVRSHDDGG